MYKNSKIFITFLSVALFLMMYSYDKGQKQISERKDDYTAYAKAELSINQGKKIESSLKTIEKLEKKYIKTDQFELSKVQAYALMGQFDKAEKSVKEAIRLNKKLENDVNLLLIYADVCINNKDNDKANQILEKIKNLEKNEEQQKKFDKLNEEMK
ncbi:hypothetical protein [Romboutsia lituseburensis]|uniref:hypothetical protein n=1 Tax=Romboutsia lituseburensis TaxID=1537 RepID=UPI00215AA99C|nr:hypothetical protein [Romboutsia lituseburensis]MCR8745463.1 hypothetical protein [Romboutsia lituseburensis]